MKWNRWIFLLIFISAHESAWGMDQPEVEQSPRIKKLSHILSELDPREQVKKPWEWPWCINGNLQVKYEEGNLKRIKLGSGILISQHCILTAASNIWNNKIKGEYNKSKAELGKESKEFHLAFENNSVKEISFHIGMEDGGVCALNIGTDEKPNYVSEFKAKDWAISEDYKQLISRQDTSGEQLWGSDFAVVCLEYPLGGLIRAAACGYKEDLKQGTQIRISGYPTYLQQDDKICTQKDLIPLSVSERSLYTMTGEITKVEKNYIQYNVITTLGQSGSGVCLKERDGEDVPFCFAIHTYGPHPDGNIGALITKKKIQEISMMVNGLEEDLKKNIGSTF